MTSKRKQTAIRKLLREIAGANTSCPIDIVKNNASEPILTGESYKFEVHNARFTTDKSGKKQMSYKVKYVPSTRRVSVGQDFISNLEQIDFKKINNHGFLVEINNNKVNLPNFDVLKFVINNLKDVKIK